MTTNNVIKLIFCKGCKEFEFIGKWGDSKLQEHWDICESCRKYGFEESRKFEMFKDIHQKEKEDRKQSNEF